VVLAAALLHDIGHGPYSHLFERVFDKNHEKWGIDIVNDPNTDVHPILDGYGLFMDVRDLYAKKLQPPFTIELIPGQLDADRLDYLLRDSYVTGATYGRYDLDWLLEFIGLATIPPNDNIGLAVSYPNGWHVQKNPRPAESERRRTTKFVGCLSIAEFMEESGRVQRSSRISNGGNQSR